MAVVFFVIVTNGSKDGLVVDGAQWLALFVNKHGNRLGR